MKKVLISGGVIIFVFALILGYGLYSVEKIRDTHYTCNLNAHEITLDSIVATVLSYCGVDNMSMLTLEEQVLCKKTAQGSVEMVDNQKMGEGRLKKCDEDTEESFTLFHKFIVDLENFSLEFFR